MVVDARELLSMGFVEVLVRLPKILRGLRAIAAAAERERPELAIVIDYPDFHFRLARRLKRLRIPVVYYIPPKVWVWRRSRLRLLKELFVRVLCILPFEEELYREAGIPVRYVGNPLADELPLTLTRADARARLGVGAGERVLVLMPGSRPSELERHLELMLDAAELVAKKVGPLRVLMPLPTTADLAALRARVAEWETREGRARGGLSIRVSHGDAHECLVAADAGLIKSGTSTLEAGILGCPHAVVYKPAQPTPWIYRNLIRYKGPVGLVNLVHGWKKGEPLLARELLLEGATVEALATEAIALLTDAGRIASAREGLARLRAIVTAGRESPSRVAARDIAALLGAMPASDRVARVSEDATHG